MQSLPRSRASHSDPELTLHHQTPCRAGDGARTRDIKLGRLALYQLSYSRVLPTPSLLPAPDTLHASSEWWGKDSNLRRHKPADLQSAPVGHLGTPPQPTESTAADRIRLRCSSPTHTLVLFTTADARADGENRTRNRLITNQVLCQLSYVSTQRVHQNETQNDEQFFASLKTYRRRESWSSRWATSC